MRKPETRLSRQQERLTYRRAVEGSLIAFFGQNRLEAQELVGGWWDWMERGSGFEGDLFMHDEPINTAGRLARAEYTPAIYEVAERYEKVLADAMPKTRKRREEPLPERHPMARAA